MLIEIRELERHPLDFDEHLAPGTIDFGTEVKQKSKLNSKGRAQLVQEHEGRHQVINDIRLVGDLVTNVELACALCLDPITRDIASNFDLLYRPLGADAGKEELSVTVA